MRYDKSFELIYPYKGEEYDKYSSQIFDYYTPLDEDHAKVLIANLIDIIDITPDILFHRWVFINLIKKEKLGWHLRLKPNITASKTLTGEEFSDETGLIEGLFERNPETMELFLVYDNGSKVKVGTSFIKEFLLDDKNDETKKPTYFQYFEDSKGDYYWEARIEDSLAPETSMQ